MIITICGSIAHLDRMIECQNALESYGHTVHIPAFISRDEAGNVMDSKEFYRIRKSGKMNLTWFEGEKARAMRQHFDLIAQSDAVLIANDEKNGVAGYIGGNTLMEMGLAFYLKKKLYLLNPIPEISYQEEIIGMQPVVLNGSVQAIK